MTHDSTPTPADPQAPWTSWPAGVRVVVRRRLRPDEVGADGQTLTDVVGVVLSADGDEVVLRRDTRPAGPPHAGHGPRDTLGDVVHVPVEQIVAGKRVPPRPVRRPASR
ncbi:hypothetical protein IF650_12620 [Cellulosimicrobium terreum]|nr:hypothetical protein [Cellulosimicrobium terreum]